MSPDAAFIEFFSADYKQKSRWARLLEETEIPGMPDASWDRKAAYLLWQATDQGKTLPAPSPAPQSSAGVFD